MNAIANLQLTPTSLVTDVKRIVSGGLGGTTTMAAVPGPFAPVLGPIPARRPSRFVAASLFRS